jgi:cytochrome c oxidase cbb3-type subunit 3
LYESNCAACHGIDLRGGQQGGPNLLRSQTLLSDKAGELVAPIVTGGRPNPPAGAPPMPPFPLPPDDIKAIAEYLHSVLAQAGAQGRPPQGEMVLPEKVLVGDQAAGQTFFAEKCSSCHSVTGDLRGVASRVPDPRELQNLWVSGGGSGGRGGRGGGSARPVTVTVRPASGAAVEGRLVRMDDFLVTLIESNGARRTIVRNGDDPKIELKDPADAHKKLVPALADKDMHNVTAYLWTIK